MIREPAGGVRLSANQGCVVSYCPVASSIGFRVLREGGNAIDAAVATGLALAVTYPQAGNIGGGGFMLVRAADGATAFLDFRETAPAKIDAEFLSRNPELSVLGAMSVGVPGTVAGFAEALKRFGSWTFARVVEPAIDLAEKGTWITARQGTYYQTYEPDLLRFESTRDAFFANGVPPLAGTLFRQPQLARTLRTLADEGPRSFYEGRIAREIIAAMRDGNGVMSEDDLNGYRAIWREPTTRRVFGREVLAASLPSGGGIVMQLALSLLHASGVSDMPADSPERAALLVRVFRVAFAARRRLVGDPDHLSEPELQAINRFHARDINSSTLAELEAEFLAQSIIPPRDDASDNTTHFCAMDARGNVASTTYTLNTLFGSKLVAGNAGFLLNNSINDFRLARHLANWYGLMEGDSAQLTPGRRPTGSMSPTIVLSQGAPEYVLGGSGGPRIPSMLVQVLLRLVLDGATLPQAMTAPRVHHQYVPDEAMVEHAVSEEARVALRSAGYRVSTQARLGIGIGVHHDSSTDHVSTVLDPRFSAGFTI